MDVRVWCFRASMEIDHRHHPPHGNPSISDAQHGVQLTDRHYVQIRNGHDSKSQPGRNDDERAPPSPHSRVRAKRPWRDARPLDTQGFAQTLPTSGCMSRPGSYCMYGTRLLARLFLTTRRSLTHSATRLARSGWLARANQAHA